jgi:hypothetical protein
VSRRDRYHFRGRGSPAPRDQATVKGLAPSCDLEMVLEIEWSSRTPWRERRPSVEIAVRGPNEDSSRQRCTQKANGTRAATCVPLPAYAAGTWLRRIAAILSLRHRSGVRNVTASFHKPRSVRAAPMSAMGQTTKCVTHLQMSVTCAGADPTQATGTVRLDPRRLWREQPSIKPVSPR